MTINWQTTMQEGTDAFQQRKHKEAIRLFNDAINFAESEFQLSEAFHLLALSYLKTDDSAKYFESEKLAATYIAHVDVGQAADFMKSAGDNLKRLRKCDLAADAYHLASEYFSNQSSIEENQDLEAAWRGWSYFCIGKSGEDCSTSFRRATDCFAEAAKASNSPALEKNRIAKAHLANALSMLCICDPSKDALHNARKHLRKASLLEESNISYNACCLALDLILFSLELEKDPKAFKSLGTKSKELEQVLEKIDYTSLLVEELHRLIEEIQFNLSETGKLRNLNLLLFEILLAVS